MTRRRFGVLALSMLVVGFSAIWIVSGQLIAPANRVVGDPPAGLGLTVTSIDSDSGSRLAVWHSDRLETSATVILLHPMHGNRRVMLGRSRFLLDNGYDVLLADMQAHGESPGEQITAGHLERLDVLAAVDFVRQRRPTHQIAIVGWSLGGAAAILANPPDVDAMVLEAVYPTIEEAIQNRVAIRLGGLTHVVSPLLLWQMPLRMGVERSQLRPIDVVDSIECPILFLAGANDQHTTLAESKRLAAKAGERCELITFENAEHVDLLNHDSDLYRDSVLPFLQRSLSSSFGQKQND